MTGGELSSGIMAEGGHRKLLLSTHHSLFETAVSLGLMIELTLSAIHFSKDIVGDQSK